MPSYTQRSDGLHMTTGTLMRPPDPREQKYGLTRLAPPLDAAIDQSRILNNIQPVRYQGGLGSCASFASETASCIAMDQQRQDSAYPLHAGWLYYHARLRRGWENEDTGSYPADNLDLLLDKVPPATAFAYSESPLWRPPTDTGAPMFDYVLSHHPFYPTEGFVPALVWTALNQGMPVVISSFWPEAFFYPAQGVLPSGVPVPTSGGHATVIFGSIPGYWLAQNSWSERWTADAASNTIYPDLRPGQFLIPWEYGTNGMIWEFRAVKAEAIAINPEPESKRYVLMELWSNGDDGNWNIEGGRYQIVPESNSYVTIKVQAEDSAIETIVPFTPVS